MATADTRRRLVWHGVLLFFLALVEGVFIYQMRNPRMGLSAHVAGLVSGVFLLALGVAWGELRLSERATAAAFWLALVGTYGSSAFLLLAALLGTGSATPIAGAGHVAPPWQEAVVKLGLQVTGAAMLVACVLLLRGFRRRAAA